MPITKEPTCPRYAEPTWEELEAMSGEPTPAEVCERCNHQGACARVYELLALGGEAIDTSEHGWMDELARALGCEGCDEWEEV